MCLFGAFLISVFGTRTHPILDLILQFYLTQLEEQTVPLLHLQLGKAEWDLRKPTVPSPPLLAAGTLICYEAESATELWILGQDLLLTGGEGEGQGAGQLVKHHCWEAVRISCWRGGVLRQHRFQADPLVDRML
jgi:hypothetical protein